MSKFLITFLLMASTLGMIHVLDASLTSPKTTVAKKKGFPFNDEGPGGNGGNGGGGNGKRISLNGELLAGMPKAPPFNDEGPGGKKRFEKTNL